MFGRKHRGRRPTNILFVIFRLVLSLAMFAVLLTAGYSAYKHFSGLDPLKMDPQAILSRFLPGLSVLKIPSKIIPEDSPKTPAKASPLFKFLLIADSHGDNANLKKALQQAKQNYPDLAFIIGLGDYTEVGTLGEFNGAKAELDTANLRYFLTAGDHDLWDSRDKQSLPFADAKGKQIDGVLTNFYKTFGSPYQSFIYENFRFILLYNSDNYAGMSSEQISWLDQELDKSKTEGQGILVFVHEPLYHPSSDHVMGRVEGGLKSQAKEIIYKLKAAGVKFVFAGDIHYFSQYEEPETKLPMITIGAIASERNPQAPRYGVVNVLKDGTLTVDDIDIK